MKIGVVALGGCWDSGVTSVLDVLRTADAARTRVDATIPALECTFVAPTDEPVRTAGGLLIPAGRLIDDCVAAADLDLLLVPALAAQSPATVVDFLMRQDVRGVRTALRRWADCGGALAAACTSTFVLAEAGLLDQRQATTTWWLSDLFRHRYPAVRLDMSRMVVSDAGVVTAGAAFAHIDLALGIVAQVSPRLAAETAGALLIEERPTPSTGAMSDHLEDHDQLTSDFEAWARAHLHSPVGVADAALALGVTRRTLERRVRDRLGTSPYAFIRSLRAERAEHLRVTTALPAADIARQVGYQDATTVRRLRGGRQQFPR
ncbi:helix-turn-helix domain-containing protein [Streptomyces sp. NPDC046881]|uniref:GlxA family transcriptional regulator n=1 Tax=Streptomyces sp. NPDC046881 TaxID=3155374 RepID=UPI00340AD094